MDMDDDLEGNVGDERSSLRVNASSSNEGRPVDAESINPPWFDEQTECAICLNDFTKGDRVRALPCKVINLLVRGMCFGSQTKGRRWGGTGLLNRGA